MVVHLLFVLWTVAIKLRETILFSIRGYVYSLNATMVNLCKYWKHYILYPSEVFIMYFNALRHKGFKVFSEFICARLFVLTSILYLMYRNSNPVFIQHMNLLQRNGLRVLKFVFSLFVLYKVTFYSLTCVQKLQVSAKPCGSRDTG